MKKILFMVSSMNIGGVEKSLISLLSTIPKDKYEITVLTLEKKGGFLEYIPSWVKVEEANWFNEIKPIIMQPPQETIKKYFDNKYYVKIPGFIASYLIAKRFDNRHMYYKNILKSIPHNSEKYDVAIAYAGPTEIIDTYIAHKVKAEKKIGWIHFDISKHCVNRKLYSELYKRFDKIFAVSEESKIKLNEQIKGIEEKSEVFLNIVSKDIIKEMAKEEVHFDNNFKGIKIVTVGRLSKEKGQDLGIKTLKRLKTDGYDVKWYCVGDGNSKSEYKNLIKKYGLEEDFILLGSKTNPYPYMKNADIYVQTSRHEGYCLTLAEAKCLNKPIITTNFTGACEQIIDNKTGFIVRCNEEEIYTKIKRLIDNRSYMRKFEENLTNIKLDRTSEVNKLYNYIGN
ncbi:MAG: glycosyltransferase [Romboutsia sp.]